MWAPTFSPINLFLADYRARCKEQMTIVLELRTTVRKLELENTKDTFMQKISAMLVQLQDLEKNGSRCTLASYC